MLSRDQIDESKQTAVFVALRHLGRDVDVTSAGGLVADVAPASPAAALLLPGDVIVAVDGEQRRIRGLQRVVDDDVAALVGRIQELAVLWRARLGSGGMREPVGVSAPAVHLDQHLSKVHFR